MSLSAAFLRYAPSHLPLPTIDDFRALLARDPYIQAVEEIRPNTIKKLPLRVINSTPEARLRFLQLIKDGSPNAATRTILQQLWLQAKALTDQLLLRLRPEFAPGHADSTFRLLVHFEAQVVQDTIKKLTARQPIQSIVWLHDGFLVSPEPTEQIIRQIEETWERLWLLLG